MSHLDGDDGPVRLDCDPGEMRARAEALLARKEKSYAELVDTEGIEDFNEKAKRVHEQVQGILDGTIDFEEFDRQEREREQLEKAKVDIKEREKRERDLKGRPGKGHKGKYELICTRCFTEYWISDIDKCTHCSNTNLLTQEERMADLRERLEEHKKKTAIKKTRRAKWENWKKTQAMFYCKTSTNYSKWDMFESESDSDKEEEPIVNEEDPQIKAMAQDFKERHQRRVRSKKLADELKKKGNEAMKRGLYKSAMHHYSQGLEERKDYLALYTNRALVALKLEDAQQAIDDCSRVLEYCEVFHDGYQKEKDLCYKALLRRGLANKFQHDFDLAKADFEEAKKIEPEGVSEAEKQLKLNEEERVHQKRLADIMANADSLKGKEYIDYLLAFLAGKMSKDIKNSEKEMKNKKKRKQLCFHELTVEEAKKLEKTLSVENMVYYFSIQNGLPMLVDSLYISTNGLPLISSILETDQKLQTDFQRAHLYEALIDLMQALNQNSEGKTLSYPDMLKILQILEAGSMNEEVRQNLSEKKKIKDLFLVVIRSIEISKNKLLIASLLSFISNLCYGRGKLKQLLANEDVQEFFKTILQILEQIKQVVKYEEVHDLDEEDLENEDPMKVLAFFKDEQRDRLTIRSSLYSFIGNLCTEAKLRTRFAEDLGGVVSQIIKDFKEDAKEQPFDWKDMVFKAMACFVNLSIEAPAQALFLKQEVLDDVEGLLTVLKSPEEEDRRIIDRIFNFLSKMLRNPEAAAKVLTQKHTVFKTLLYFHRQFKDGDLQLNALRTLHPLTKLPNFKHVCQNDHKFTLKTFDTYVTEINQLFKDSLDEKKNDGKQDWNLFVNACASATSFLGAFPERVQDFKPMILDLIHVIKEKTGVVRSNAAVLLAKLAADEELNKYIRANHGFDVLLSLREQFCKPEAAVAKTKA